MSTDWVGLESGRRNAADRARRPHWIRRGLIAVVLLVVVGHLAAGWYFAGQIESQAFTVDPWTWPEDDQLVAATDSTVTVRDLGDQTRELRTAGTFELIWNGGRALIDGAPEIHGSDVTRHLADTGEALPPVGTEVGVSSFVTPVGFIPPHEVTYTGPSGPLTGEVDYAVSNTTWAILVHGKGADPSEQYRLMYLLQQAGITTLSISYRNDVGAPADPSHRYGYGATEWRDLAAAVDYARTQGATRLLLGGASMGGAIVASYLTHTHPPDVRAVILDSPMLDLRSTVEWEASRMSPPPPPTVDWAAEHLATWRYGVDWGSLDYLSDPTWATVPILVLHGDHDSTVPLATSQVLAHRRWNVHLVTIKGAEHVESWNVNPAAYDAAVDDFLHRTTLAAW